MSELTPWRKYKVTPPTGEPFVLVQMEDRKEGKLGPLLREDGSPETFIRLADLLMPEQRLAEYEVEQIKDEPQKDSEPVQGARGVVEIFNKALKLDRFQYLRGIKRVDLIPDRDKWNGEYNGTEDVITFEKKWLDKPFENQINILLHEIGHRGQMVDPETYQAYLDKKLNQLDYFLAMANAVHQEDYKKNGIDPESMTMEVFAESYSRFCLDWSMPRELEDFWRIREALLHN